MSTDRDAGIRLAALDRAIEAWEGNKEYVEGGGSGFVNKRSADIRTDRILATAAKFEAYLRSPYSSEAGTE